jgi:excisionase family DNA binding protein
MNIDTEKLLTLKEAAEELSLALDTVRVYVRMGTLGSIKVGFQRFVRRSDIEEFKAKRK